MRTLSLLKAKLEGTTFFGGGFRSLRERDQLWVVPVAVAGVAVGLATLVFLLYQNYRGMALLGATMGTPALSIYLGVVAGWALIFILGFPIAISVLYFSRDTRLLASLPIPAYRIVAANAGVLYLYSLPLALLFFVPALVASQAVLTGAGAAAGVAAGSVGAVAPAGGAATGAAAGAGAAAALNPVAYWLLGALIVLMLPVVPLALAVCVVTLVTRLVNLSRFRTALETLGMVLVVLVLVGTQLVLSRSLAAGDGSLALSEQMRAIVARLYGAVPPARWYAGAFIGGGFPTMLGALAGTLLLGAGAILAVQAGYLRQLANQSVTRTRRTGAAPAAMPAPRVPLRALLGRELKVLTSNSTFLFESAGELLVFPIILGILRLSTPAEVLGEIMPVVEQTDYLLPLLTVALVVLAGINTVSSAALSREGRTFDLSLTLPLPGSTQVSAKVLIYVMLFGSAMLLNAVLAVWILARPWWYVPLVFVAALPFVWLIGVTTIYADIRRPLLRWNHPQQAVKQNMNVLLGMGIAIVALATAAAPAAMLALRGAPSPAVMLLGSGFALVAAWVISGLVSRYADRRYALAFSR